MNFWCSKFEFWNSRYEIGYWNSKSEFGIPNMELIEQKLMALDKCVDTFSVLLCKSILSKMASTKTDKNKKWMLLLKTNLNLDDNHSFRFFLQCGSSEHIC